MAKWWMEIISKKTRFDEFDWLEYSVSKDPTYCVFCIGSSFCWNLAYVDAYTDLLWEQNTVRSLKSTAEVVQANRTDIVMRYRLCPLGMKKLRPIFSYDVFYFLLTFQYKTIANYITFVL